MNLRWSWHAPTQDLFEGIDPAVWASVAGDPVRLLGEVRAGRLAELAADDRFVSELDDAVSGLRQYLTEPRWFQQEQEAGADLPDGIAYFSMEFGVSEVLPNYSGGLGILAGDHLKAASDLGLPLIGVGLLYRSGYFRQSLTADGWQAERYPSLDPQGLPLHLLSEADGEPVMVHVSMPGDRVLHARVWVARVGRIPLLLLDSDIADNDVELRGVTDRLYGGDQDHRVKQEILAGVGGVRAVRAYTRVQGLPDPTVFHMNEGHAGFLGLERVRELLSSDSAEMDFDTALTAVRAATVFTTHTPVPAGIDRFPADLVRHYFGDGALLPGIALDDILALGRESDPSVFNMAHMGLRSAQRANGVSLLHGEVSRGMFDELWPGFDAAEVPIGSVTNGVHDPTWASRRWDESSQSPAEMSDEDLWAMRTELRTGLVEEVRRRIKASWLERGATEAELSWTAEAFDPSVLTVGFARRVPTYKRLTLMLRQPERLRAMLLDPERPVQLIVAGKSHPADEGGKALIQQIVRFADEADVRHRITFLPDYDMSMARHLYWGCDVWLNNPLRPLEACGTSGMKSALNGGLNLSIRDGWWDEMYDGENGWAIPTADGVIDETRRDDLEASALYELLEKSVLPKFYDRTGENVPNSKRTASGVPTRWTQMVRHTLVELGPKVLASRMVREYTERYYGPASIAGREVAAEGYAGARSLAEFRRRIDGAWSSISVTEVDSSGLADIPVVGAPFSLSAHVQLAGLSADDVVVQAVLGTVDDEENMSNVVTVPMAHTGDSADGRAAYSVDTSLPMSGPVGYTVRVLPHHPLLAGDAELGRVSGPVAEV